MISLRNVLKINGLSSGATGLGLLLFAPALAPLFGLDVHWPLYETGVFLLLFGLFVLYQAGLRSLSSLGVRIICSLDVLWVLASLFILLFQAFGLSALGYVLIGAVALWVALMAILQWRGLKQLA